MKPIRIFLLVGSLLLSWYFPPTRLLWDKIDLGVYFSLNHLLSFGTGWQVFWAVQNHIIMDWIHDVIILIVYGIYIFKASKLVRIQRAFQVLFCLAFFWCTIYAVNKGIVTKIFHPYRDSPTRVYSKEAIVLSNEIDWMHIKDNSKTSYPGDHGTFITLFAISIFYLMGRRAGLIASAYALFFCLPRLIVGAHWFTDIVMGSLPIALCATSLVFYTPFEAALTSRLANLFYRREIP